MPAKGASGGILQGVGRIKGRGAAGAGKVDLDLGLPATGDKFRNPGIDAYVLGGVRCLAGNGFGQWAYGQPTRSTDEIAGARPRFQPAVALQLPAQLDGGGQADFMPSHQGPD